jgi:hypothetical protein
MEIAWVRFISLALLFTLPACNEARAQDSGRASAPERISGREEVCGWVFPVESYHADIAGLSIALTANDRLLINGRVVAENPPLHVGNMPLPWHDSANTARVARAGDRILVRTTRTDCIDGAASRIYVLNRQGALEASNRLWSEHWRDGFFRERDSIIYWSEWFCQANPSIRPMCTF